MPGAKKKKLISSQSLFFSELCEWESSDRQNRTMKKWFVSVWNGNRSAGSWGKQITVI